MASRYAPQFRILTLREPFKRSPVGSVLRMLAGAVLTALNDLVSYVNFADRSMTITDCDGEVLDKYGELLNLARNADEGEDDETYRNRLLTDFRNLPEGLTYQDLYDAVFSVIAPEEPEIIEWYAYDHYWPDENDDTRDPGFVWDKYLQEDYDRFTVSVVTVQPLSPPTLDEIEENVVNVKGAHVLVWIVQLRPEGYELLREIR
jgi:hypothetical protein